MLRLRSISLFQFRNYTVQSFAFNERVIGICGLNGTGKTNLLDAIYYLSFTKSYLYRPDNQNVHHGLQGLRIEGNYTLNNDPHQLVCILRENNKKEFLVNGEEYKKFSEHIGKYPCVMIAPDDVELINGSSEERRKLIDTVLSQINKVYLQHLIDYNKLLLQRNSLLKQFAEQTKPDESLLEIITNQLVEKGQFIFEERKAFLEQFLPKVNSFYQKISGRNESIGVAYQSQLSSRDMKGLLSDARQKEIILQRTTIGIHRDDIDLMINNASFKSEASQGQKKSLLFALKLAEWQVLKEVNGFAPILLLDDLFEKLDQERMHNLLHWVYTEEDGQIFITDTHQERLIDTLKNVNISYQLIAL